MGRQLYSALGKSDLRARRGAVRKAKMEEIRVLILSHMYPKKINPKKGIFIHNLVKYLLKAGCRVRVTSPVPYAPKFLRFNSK